MNNKSIESLRPAANITYAVKFWDGANYSYQVAGAPVIFGTKKAAAKYINENFSGDARRIRLHDLIWAGRMMKKFAGIISPSRADIAAVKVAKLRTLCRNYRGANNPLCLEKVWNCGRGRTNFIQVCTETNTIYYNTLLTRRADLENIKSVFPEYQLQPVNLPYWDTCSMKSYYQRINK